MITPSPPRFGSLLRSYRTAAGLTQEALAERARISKRGLQDLERGVSRTPRRDTIELLATALGLGAHDRAALLAAVHQLHSPARSSPTTAATPNALAPLVGRRRELALLDRFLAGEHAPMGSAPVLLLAGEPGIGKTRLLQASAQLAITLGWCVLVGGCYRRGGQEPYAPLLDALAQHLHAAGPAQLRAALSGCAWLVRLLPELAEQLEPLPGFSPALEQERRLIFASVTRLLTNVAGPAGTLLVLDDLQWAGVDALDLLASLAHTAGLPLRIIGAYRATEVKPADPLGLLLADLAQAGLITHTALGPLEAEDAAALLDHLLVGTEAVRSAMREHVVRRAGGLPFFLVSHAQALRAGAAESVPWDLAQSVRQRITLLPETAQTLLGAAAVIGRQVSRTVLMRTTGLPETEVVEGLVGAWRARLLLEEGGDAYVFAHDVVREVVEADLGAAQRAMLHRKVAEALEQDRDAAPAELLAYHYTRAGILDKAVRHLEQAGDHAWTQRAHAAAEIHYREALDLLERLGRARDALGVREKLGDVLKWTGRYEAALHVLEPAAKTYRAAGELEGLGRIAASVAQTDALTGAFEEGMVRLQPSLDVLERGGASAALAALYMWQGVFLAIAGRYVESLAASERAAELARAGGDDRTLVKVTWNRAGTLQLLGRLEESRRANQQILPLAEALGDLDSLISMHRDLAYIHVLRGAFVAGERHIEQSFALAEQLENPANVAFTLAIRGWIATLCGDWQRAQADLDRALAVSRQLGWSWYSPYPPIFLACLSLAEGDRAAAAASVREALSLGEWSKDWQALRLASAVMAEIDLLEGRPEAARDRLIPLLDRLGQEECDVTTLLPVLGWAYLDLGQYVQAADTVERALARARPEDMRLVLVEALRVRALVALRQERWDEAARSLEEGVALAQGMPYPYAEARLLSLSAVRYRGCGDLDRADERLSAAQAIFSRLGARSEAARIGQELTAVAQHPSAVPPNPAPSPAQGA